ncbi:hypothetical protein AYO47_04425 [Planctomyces sp. SCGC AG-212-M04]|nr:hypothetical protein AYO47_04425 [Planctomyces sp. SCGC AG-212-M04]
MKFFLEQSRARCRRQPTGGNASTGLKQTTPLTPTPIPPAGNAGLMNKPGKLGEIGKRSPLGGGIAVQGFNTES